VSVGQIVRYHRDPVYAELVRIQERKRYTPKKAATMAIASRLRLYGVSEGLYQTLLDKQDGRCAICGRLPDKRKLGVDHNHETGEVRGLLCQQCNHAIGLLGDDPQRLQAAIDYLKQPVLLPVAK
jgi:hypothetical protein